MGNRIHKVIGCGFRYSKLDKDPRFNNGIFNSEDNDLRFKLIEYIDGLVSEKDDFDFSMLKQQLKCEGWFKDEKFKEFSMYDVIKYSSYGSEQMATPIIVTNPMEKDWYRYDDIIDYYDAPTSDDGSPIDHVKLIVDDANQPCGIYPYCARYVHRNTGKFCEKIHTTMRWTTTNACLAEGIKDPFKSENPMGIDGSLIQWQRHIVPQLPPFISVFCDAFKIFKNPMTKHRLRPMILTYWC